MRTSKANVYAHQNHQWCSRFSSSKRKTAAYVWFQDYWKLNVMTVKNVYPLPLIPDILNKVSEAKAKYFAKLDIHWGYNNIWIKEGEEWKATFWTNQGLLNLWSCSSASRTVLPCSRR